MGAVGQTFCSLEIVSVRPLNREPFNETEPRNAPNFTDAIRVFWQFPSLSKSSDERNSAEHLSKQHCHHGVSAIRMRSSSPTECSPFVYPDLAFEADSGLHWDS